MQLKNVIAKNNYESLFDYKIVFGLMCVLPMLELMQNLSNMAQGRETFVICNFVISMIFYQGDMYTFYENLVNRYDYPQFQNFYDLVNHFCYSLHMMHDGWNKKSMLNMHVTF